MRSRWLRLRVRGTRHGLIVLRRMEILIVFRLHVVIAVLCGGRVPSSERFRPGLKGRIERREDTLVATFAEVSCAHAARCTGGLVSSEPDAFTNVMAMLEILDPSRAGLESLVGDLKVPRSFLCFIADGGIRKKGVLLLHLDEPADELFFHLGELGRAGARDLAGAGWGRENVPVLGHTHVVVLGDVHPFCFVFEDFADGAAFDAVTGSNVFLAGVRILLVVHANGLAVYIEETLLALLGPRDDGTYRWGRERICSKGLRIRNRRRG